MKSNLKTQFTNIGSMSGFPSGEAGYELGVSACYAGFIGDYLVVAVDVISRSQVGKSIIPASMLRRLLVMRKLCSGR